MGSVQLVHWFFATGYLHLQWCFIWLWPPFFQHLDQNRCPHHQNPDITIMVDGALKNNYLSPKISPRCLMLLLSHTEDKNEDEYSRNWLIFLLNLHTCKSVGIADRVASLCSYWLQYPVVWWRTVGFCGFLPLQLRQRRKCMYVWNIFFLLSDDSHLRFDLNRLNWGVQRKHRVGINQGGYRQRCGHHRWRSTGSPGCSAWSLHRQPSKSERLCPHGSEAWVSEKVLCLKWVSERVLRLKHTQ